MSQDEAGPDIGNVNAAWAAMEAAMPKGWRFESLRRRYAGSRFIASAVRGGIGQQERSHGTVPNQTGYGPTPAAALLALAAALGRSGSGGGRG